VRNEGPRGLGDPKEMGRKNFETVVPVMLTRVPARKGLAGMVEAFRATPCVRFVAPESFPYLSGQSEPLLKFHKIARGSLEAQAFPQGLQNGSGGMVSPVPVPPSQQLRPVAEGWFVVCSEELGRPLKMR